MKVPMCSYRSQHGFALTSTLLSFVALAVVSALSLVVANKYVDQSQENRSNAEGLCDIYCHCTNDCTVNSYQCAGSTLQKCLSQLDPANQCTHPIWVTQQTCAANTTCNAAAGSCSPSCSYGQYACLNQYQCIECKNGSYYTNGTPNLVNPTNCTGACSQGCASPNQCTAQADCAATPVTGTCVSGKVCCPPTLPRYTSKAGGFCGTNTVGVYTCEDPLECINAVCKLPPPVCTGQCQTSVCGTGQQTAPGTCSNNQSCCKAATGLANNSPCTADSQCQSGHCQLLPGGIKACTAGTPLISQAGELCGTTSFGTYTCAAGLTCQNSRCQTPLLADGTTCTADSQCQSGHCNYHPGDGKSCGPAIINNCTRGASFCNSDGTRSVCKADKSGYATQTCAAGTTCNAATGACSSACSGQCISSMAFANGNYTTASGSCSSGFVCAQTGPALLPSGASCTASTQCVIGLMCIQGKCASASTLISPAGGPCNHDNFTCQAGLTCVSQTCRAPQTCTGSCVSSLAFANGNYTTATGSCATGYVCAQAGAALLPSGAGCTNSSQCVIGLMCIQGKCASASTLISPAGGPCNHDNFTCSSGLTCTNQTCRTPVPTQTPTSVPTSAPQTCTGQCISSLAFANGNYTTDGVSGSCAAGFVCAKEPVYTCNGSCLTSAQCAEVTMEPASGTCSTNRICCKPKTITLAKLPTACMEQGDSCYKTGFQPCMVSGIPGKQLCNFTACGSSRACDSQPVNCGTCIPDQPVCPNCLPGSTASCRSAGYMFGFGACANGGLCCSTITLAGAGEYCEEDADCESKYTCSRAHACVEVTALKPTVPVTTTTTTGKPCSGGKVLHGTYFCYGSSCMRCDNGYNTYVSPSECAGKADVSIGGLSCIPTTQVISPYQYYCSQTDSSIRNTPKYTGCNITFAQKGCGETVVSMVAAAKYDTACNPVQTAENYYDPATACDGTTQIDELNALTKIGVEASPLKGSVTKDKIIDFLNNGWDAIMGCTINGISHYTLARDVIGDDIVFSDPYFGDGTVSGQQIIINNYNACDVTLVKI